MLCTKSRNAALVREVQEIVGFVFLQPAWPLASMGVLTAFGDFLAEKEGQKEKSVGRGPGPYSLS